MKVVEAVRAHPKLVLLLALLFTAVMAVIGSGAQNALLAGGTTDPAASSSQVTSDVDRLAPGLAPNVVVLVTTPGGPDTPRPGPPASG
jgi:RND superfamily putative drug exporter